jgi:DNA (cytosine-5)-methyltransferase 1
MTKRSASARPTRAKRKIRVIELFAGVGGFRLGLDGKNAAKRRLSPYVTIWANQWEPGSRRQHAAQVYREKFPDADAFPGFNEDINRVIDGKWESIPDHDLLVGGFPCQDYSVAKPANQASGIVGKKGVLWWSIHSILEKKGVKACPRFLFLENVDRLVKSPTSQRGRDFAIMLASLANLGYAAEWRVVNAADYGFAQRRRRTFIVAFHSSSELYKSLKSTKNPYDWIASKGVFGQALPVESVFANSILPDIGLVYSKTATTEENLVEITRAFNKGNKIKTPFLDAGVMLEHNVWTAKVTPKYSGKRLTLGQVLVAETEVPAEFRISKSEIDAPRGWRYLKGAKSEKRTKKSGFEYTYDEGAMSFPDDLDKPSRTIITSEGGSAPSRFKHVVKTRNGYRRLTPVELERLNGFPDDHTKLDGISNSRRAFFMGNALVVGVVERIAKTLASRIQRG